MARPRFDARRRPTPSRCPADGADFPPDSTASSCSRPRCTATRAASSWRPSAPTRGPAEGVPTDFVQDNHSRSRRGTLRGIHFQTHPGQGKLVRVARGRVLDVVVDLRRGSPTFGEWEGVELDDEHGAQLCIPVGFGHGFCVLSDTADFVYKCTSYYDPATEAGIRFDDPDVGVEWPDDIELLYSERDRDAPRLADVADDAAVPLRRMSTTAASRPSPTGHAAPRQPAHRAAGLAVRPLGRRALPRADGGPRPRAACGRRRRAPARGPARARARLGRRGRLPVASPSRLRGRDRAPARRPAACTSASARARRSARRRRRRTGRCPRAPTRAPACGSPRPSGGASAPAAGRRRCACAPSGARVAFTDRLHGAAGGRGRRLRRAPQRRRARLQPRGRRRRRRGRASARSCAATTCSTPRRASCSSPGCSACPRPTYAHVPLVLGPDGARLAKRHGAVTLDDARRRRRACAGWRRRSACRRRAAAELLDAFDPDALPRAPTRWRRLAPAAGN